MASSCTLFGLFSNSRRFTHTKSQTWTFEKLRDLATVGPHSFVVTIVWSWSMKDEMDFFPPFVHNTHPCLLLLPAHIYPLSLITVKVRSCNLSPRSTCLSLPPNFFLISVKEKSKSISPNPGVGGQKGQVE